MLEADGSLRRDSSILPRRGRFSMAHAPYAPILLVGGVAGALRGALERARFAVHAAEDGHAALVALASGLRPGLVVLDFSRVDRIEWSVLDALDAGELEAMPLALLAGRDEPYDEPADNVHVFLEPWDVGAVVRLASRLGISRRPGKAIASPVILIVEDDDDHRATMTEVLREAGYHVRTAHHGQAALTELAVGPPPSLILLDMRMPVLDGWGFMAEFRRDPLLHAIPIVAVSESSKVVLERPARVAKCLRKPLDHEQLLRTIERCLTEREGTAA
jgi:CheY-like chemotaxis protein